MSKVALLGATGALGRALAFELGARNEPYRAVSRSEMGLQVRIAHDPLAEPVLWDPEQKPSILQALEGTTKAVYVVGAPLWEFEKHLPLTQLVIEACREANVQKLLLISSHWAYGLPQTASISETHPLAATTTKGRIRAQQEQMILQAHQPGILQTAVLRSAEFYGPHVEASTLWSAFRAARTTALGKKTEAQLLPGIDLDHQFVFTQDAAKTALRMLDDEDKIWGHPWNLAGPATTTVRAMTEQIFQAAGVPQATYTVPPRWKLKLVAMMNPYVRALKEMRYLQQLPILLNDEALEQTLGPLNKTPYAQGIEQTLPTVRVGRV